MSWMGVITNAGQSLLDQWLVGEHTLTILGATVGSGITPAVNMRSAAALANEEDDASIVGTEENNGATKFKVQVSGAPATAYVAHEIGIWAKLDNGERTLLALHQDADTGVAIPKKADAPNFAFMLYAIHNIDNDGTLVVNIDETAFVSTGTFNSAISTLNTEKLDATGNSQDCTVNFISGDRSSPTAWEAVDVVNTGEKHSSLLNKITTMIKNVRWLYKMLGTTDISSIGGGTVTGALSKLNTDLIAVKGKIIVQRVTKTINNGYVAVPYPSGVTYLSHDLVIQPMYGGGLIGWTATVQLTTAQANVYVRIGSAVPEDGSTIDFSALFIAR